MKIPKYWARSVQVVRPQDGTALRLVCWQWSDLSTDEAQQKANERLSGLVQRVAAGQVLLNRYSYGDRPLREEITQSIPRSSGGEIGVVTRNLYGALVLNTANAMFVDIDFAEKNVGASAAGALRRVLGAHSPSQQEQYIQSITAWAAQHPELGVRIYRTFAGLRCLITNRLFEPAQADSLGIMRALGSDPLYIRLCQAQACFRARLTPKPWRCGMGAPDEHFPLENPAAHADFRSWLQRYDRAIVQYSVCKFVTQLGSGEVHPDVEPVLKLHDRMTCSDRNLNLA